MPMRFRSMVLTVALAAGAIPVAAHVRVYPDADNTQARACAFAKFVVRVPVERPANTVRVDLAIPKGVRVVAVQPKTGWQFALETIKGVVTKISWTGKLAPHEFDEFAFLAATPKNAGTVNWDAWQYYDDRTIVGWTGPANADTPHSVTVIRPGACKAPRKVTKQ